MRPSTPHAASHATRTQQDNGFNQRDRYEHDSAHVLQEEDGIEKQLHSDLDQSDQQELHKELLEAHQLQEKEHTALDKVGVTCDV
jgi:hypothetical protein